MEEEEIMEEIEKEKTHILINLVPDPEEIKIKIDLIKPRLIIMVEEEEEDFKDKTTMDLLQIMDNKIKVVIDQMVCNLKDLVVNNNKTNLHLKFKRTIMMNLMLLKIEVRKMFKNSEKNIKLQYQVKFQFQIQS
jgi:hypothetical protein